MTGGSAAQLLVLHAVRILGFADVPAIAGRFDLPEAVACQEVEAARSEGWMSYATFADLSGWSLTELGRVENERLLATELEHRHARGVVKAAYTDFLPLNTRLQRACTHWQLRPAPGDPLAVNDHSDRAWDAGVVVELADLGAALVPLVARLTGTLPRFEGYDQRYLCALARVRSGETEWVDRTDRDSCHRAWFELHEDLVATLRIDRGAPD
ncbi:transcriptional regulator [Pseudactinotalea sp.]|uniref:transcriptional regulator n=1 Tax=Pseudactinotalea sp. TaxID=1926260 RepID=UPI003B3AE494